MASAFARFFLAGPETAPSALKARGSLNTSLRFTVQDGVYWYNEKGSITQIDMGKNAEALILGLSAGKYVLEETVVPNSFFPTVTQNVEIMAADAFTGRA